MLPPPPQNFILFELDFDVKFPFLRLSLFLSDLKSTILGQQIIFIVPASKIHFLYHFRKLVQIRYHKGAVTKMHFIQYLTHIYHIISKKEKKSNKGRVGIQSRLRLIQLKGLPSKSTTGRNTPVVLLSVWQLYFCQFVSHGCVFVI